MRISERNEFGYGNPAHGHLGGCVTIVVGYVRYRMTFPTRYRSGWVAHSLWWEIL